MGKRKEAMPAACDESINQINERGYAKEFVEDYVQIMAYGVAFYRKFALVKMMR